MGENNNNRPGISCSKTPSVPPPTPQRSSSMDMSLYMMTTNNMSPPGGPMSLVSSFFPTADEENHDDIGDNINNCEDSQGRSFSQLLAGALSTTTTAAANNNNDRVKYFTDNTTSSSSSSSSRNVGNEFYNNNNNNNNNRPFQQNRPAGLVISQSSSPQGEMLLFTIPPGLISPPASLLLNSPPGAGGFFSSSPSSQHQGGSQYGVGGGGISHEQIMSQFTSQPHNLQLQYYSDHNQYPHPYLTQLQPLRPNASSSQHQITIPFTSDSKIRKNFSNSTSHFDHKSQPTTTNITVDKPSEDGYNWRKYGQKQVKGSEYPRSYYKCTHPTCPVKKKVERSLDGHITEIIYKGQHNHPPNSKRARENANQNGTHVHTHHGNAEFGYEGQIVGDQESSQFTADHISGSSDGEEVGDAETYRADEDEPESKRRNIDVQTSDQASSHRTLTEPRIIVQATSEVDLLDDGYRWRKYGQKVVKGNPYPRSYYKCISPGCNVRKHVERAATDPKAVITTYEGKHTHDVPAARNSSQSTANASSTQLRPNNPMNNRLVENRSMQFGNNDQQPPVALLQFKEEQIT